MSPKWRSLPAWWVVATLFAVLSILAPSTPSVLAQNSNPSSTDEPAASADMAAEMFVSTATATNIQAPTPVPTYTDLQARMALAHALLRGGDFAGAKELFTAIALEDRGNAEALAGLDAALAGVAAGTPSATPIPTATPQPVTPTFGATFGQNWRDLAGTALPGLLAILLVYVLAIGARWLLYASREFLLVHALPRLGYPSVKSGYLLGTFSNALPKDVLPEADKLVSQAIAARLLAWNELVRVAEIPVEEAPALKLGGMEWIQILWRWILPPPRGYRVDGALLQSGPSVYELHLQRTRLATNTLDRSRFFQTTGSSPTAAFRLLATEGAKWLISPTDIEGEESVLRPMSVMKGGDVGETSSASALLDAAMEQLLPLRRQATLGAIDFPDARRRLSAAEALLQNLPDGSHLRDGLSAAIRDLRRSVPPA